MSNSLSLTCSECNLRVTVQATSEKVVLFVPKIGTAEELGCFVSKIVVTCPECDMQVTTRSREIRPADEFRLMATGIRIINMPLIERSAMGAWTDDEVLDLVKNLKETDSPSSFMGSV